jgi:hypothetical protein
MTESKPKIVAQYENRINYIKNSKRIRGDGFDIQISYYELDHSLEVETPDEATIVIKLTRIAPTQIEYQESP